MIEKGDLPVFIHCGGLCFQGKHGSVPFIGKLDLVIGRQPVERLDTESILKGHLIRQEIHEIFVAVNDSVSKHTVFSLILAEQVQG